MRKNNTAIIFGSLFFSCSVMAANGTLAPTVVPMVNGGHPEVTMTALSPVWLDSRSRYLRDMYRPGMVMEQWNPETRSHDRYVIDRVAGLVMTVLTVGLVSCAGKSLPRFWPGDFFPTFYACHLAVLGVLRIDQGSAPSVSVTGARNDKDKERIMSLLEEIWQDDSWLPAA